MLRSTALGGLLMLAMGTGTAPVSAADAPLSIHNLPICMNFSCRRKEIISLNEEEWDSIANWLRQPAADARTEREHIQQAIGWMEVIAGRHTPSHLDVGGDLQNGAVDFPGQLDCIDESLNTTTYLTLFENHQLLKFHRVVERAYRRSVFDQHWAGQLKELETGNLWVVDSWFQNNGYLPYVQRTEKWEEIPFFTSYLDSSQDRPEEKVSFFRRLFK